MPFDYPVAGTPVPATGVNEEETDMSLKKYDVEINGFPTTLLLSDEDAKAQGLEGKHRAAKAADPEPEPVTDPAPEPVTDPAPEPAKGRTPANKSRSAANK